VENGEFKQFTAGGQEQQQWQQPTDPSPFCGINFQDEIFYTRSNGCEYIFFKKIHFALFSANDDSDESDESEEDGSEGGGMSFFSIFCNFSLFRLTSEKHRQIEIIRGNE